MVIPSPFVYWAQTESVVTLKVDLKNVGKPNFKIVDNNIKFSAHGTGARGDSQYEFSLDLYEPLKKLGQDEAENVIVARVFENRVDLTLHKAKAAWWPRLTAQPQKPAWLKINFDLWKSEDGLDSEEETRDIMKDYPDMYDRLHKEEMGYRKGITHFYEIYKNKLKEDLKQVYLKLYNLFQFIGYMYIVCVMCIRYARLEGASVPDTYEHVGPAMKFLQLMMYLEVLHPLFGYTKGGALVPFMQVSGRAFILFAMIDAEPRIQTKPVVFILFAMWSMIEIVRYPFYISQLYKKEIYILTWLRYTMWIPLYPIGIVCESLVIIRNIPYLEENLRFTVSLPNAWNFAFHMPTFLRVYVLLLTFPGMFFVMMHMRALRSAKLKSPVSIKKVK